MSLSLHDSGWNALLLDLRHHGQSGGEATTFGAKESEDILAAARLARERAPGPVVLWGVSLGAASVALAAAEDRSVAGVICDSSYRSLDDTVRHHLQLFRGWRWWVRLVPSWPVADLTIFWIGQRGGFDPASVLPPTLMALFTAGWLFLPGSPLVWTLLVLLPSILPIGVQAVQQIRHNQKWYSLKQVLKLSQLPFYRCALSILFLPYEALLALSAIGITIARLFITHKHLLQWTTAANAARSFKMNTPYETCRLRWRFLRC